jgi:hypothetical protein
VRPTRLCYRRPRTFHSRPWRNYATRYESSGTSGASKVHPPKPAMSAEGAKRRQHPGFDPTPDDVRRYPEDIGDVARREYFAVVVLGLADKRRCRLRFALPLRTRFALVLRTRNPLRCWCRRDAPPERSTDLGEIRRTKPHSGSTLTGHTCTTPRTRHLRASRDLPDSVATAHAEVKRLLMSSSVPGVHG